MIIIEGGRRLSQGPEVLFVSKIAEDVETARDEMADAAEQHAAHPLMIIGKHLHVGEPRGIVDRQEVVADILAGAETVAGDAMADAIEAGEPS